jgi:uncharacterized membrane protein YheB (UPF0754 family)
MTAYWLLLTLPLIGGLIGWLTNRLAIQMLFRPRKPWRIGPWAFQGLIPRRQGDLAVRTGQIVEQQILQQHVLQAELRRLDLKPYLGRLTERLVRQHLASKLRDIPLLGTFINDRLLAMLERMALESLEAELPALMDELAAQAEQHIAIGRIVEERVRGLDLDTLERVVRELARREFRAIEWLGGVLGLLIGCVQALLLLAGWGG